MKWRFHGSNEGSKSQKVKVEEKRKWFGLSKIIMEEITKGKKRFSPSKDLGNQTQDIFPMSLFPINYVNTGN